MVPVQAQNGLLQQGRGMFEGLLQGRPGGSGLAEAEIGAGLREALRVGSERVIANLGRVDGFSANPDVRIALPGSLQSVSRRSPWSACPASPTISSCA
jgi:hypothetical protein